jgi:glycosyltransferase involved in cell wall biosynthesis
MRISIERVVPALDVGGVESLLRIHAAEHDRERFELRVCTFWKAGRAAEDVRKLGIPVTEIGVDPRIRNPRATALYLRHLRRTRPALVHATVPEADFHASIAARLAGIPCFVDEAGVPSRRFVGRAVFAALHRSAAGIIAVSSQLRDVLVRDEHAPISKITVVPTCADRASFERPKAHYEREGALRVVALGRLMEIKNYEVLVRAMRRLADRGFDARLEVAGEGPQRATLERLIATEGVGDRVRLLGYHDDRAGLLRGADVYAIPSWSEGCSLSLIEAMAAAVPVIASRVPGNLEVVGPSLAAWTAPPEDPAAWADLLTRIGELDAAERRALGEAGRSLATLRFSPGSYVGTLERLYEKTAEGARRDRKRAQKDGSAWI